MLCGCEYLKLKSISDQLSFRSPQHKHQQEKIGHVSGVIKMRSRMVSILQRGAEPIKGFPSI